MTEQGKAMAEIVRVVAELEKKHMSKGEEFTSVFDIHSTMPDVMFPLPYVHNKEYGHGDMILFIGKAGGGTLGREYTGERWFGEVRHYADNDLNRFEIVHSGDFYIGHTADHLKAAKEYADIISADSDENEWMGDWRYRVEYWANQAFEDDDEE